MASSQTVLPLAAAVAVSLLDVGESGRASITDHVHALSLYKGEDNTGGKGTKGNTGGNTKGAKGAKAKAGEGPQRMPLPAQLTTDLQTLQQRLLRLVSTMVSTRALEATISIVMTATAALLPSYPHVATAAALPLLGRKVEELAVELLRKVLQAPVLDHRVALGYLLWMPQRISFSVFQNCLTTVFRSLDFARVHSVALLGMDAARAWGDSFHEFMQECDHIILNSRMWDQLQRLQVPFDHNLLMTSERNSPAQRRLVVTVLHLTAYVYTWVLYKGLYMGLYVSGVLNRVLCSVKI